MSRGALRLSIIAPKQVRGSDKDHRQFGLMDRALRSRKGSFLAALQEGIEGLSSLVTKGNPKLTGPAVYDHRAGASGRNE